MFQHVYPILTEPTFSPHIFDKFQGFSEGNCGFTAAFGPLQRLDTLIVHTSGPNLSSSITGGIGAGSGSGSGSGSRPGPELGLRLRVDEARLFWAQGDSDLAICALKNVASAAHAMDANGGRGRGGGSIFHHFWIHC